MGEVGTPGHSACYQLPVRVRSYWHGCRGGEAYPTELPRPGRCHHFRILHRRLWPLIVVVVAVCGQASHDWRSLDHLSLVRFISTTPRPAALEGAMLAILTVATSARSKVVMVSLLICLDRGPR